MEVNRLRRIGIEDFKALKSLHPDFMHDELAVSRAKSFDCDTTVWLTKFGGLSN